MIRLCVDFGRLSAQRNADTDFPNVADHYFVYALSAWILSAASTTSSRHSNRTV